MGEGFIIFLKILFSFLSVVGFIYLCSEIIEFFTYRTKKCRLPVTINSQDFSYEEIFTMLRAFSSIMNSKAADYLFDKITILTKSESESENLAEYLGRYAMFADIQNGADEKHP